jgi:cytochrome c biogenesis protein CcdA
MGVGISFLSGIVAAFTPCVIVLFPLVLYRFFSEDKKEIKPYLLFTGGFLIAYLLFGYFISGLLSSFIQNGFKVGLGLLFIILGILSVMGKLNPLHFPLVKNSFLLGVMFALALSFNPCSLPYLGVIIGLGNHVSIIANILFYALGLLVPSILFAFIGQSIFKYARGTALNTVNKIMSIVLIIAGVYLLTTIRGFAQYDIIIVTLFTILITMVILRAFFVINSKKDILKPKNSIMLLAMILIIIAIVYNCQSFIIHSTPQKSDLPLGIKLQQIFYEQESCGETNVLHCAICMRCISLFGGATLLFLTGTFLNAFFDKQTQKQFQSSKQKRKKRT